MPLVEKQLYDPFSIYAGQIFDWNKLDLDHDVHTFRQLLVRALQRHDSSIPIVFGGSISTSKLGNVHIAWSNAHDEMPEWAAFTTVRAKLPDLPSVLPALDTCDDTYSTGVRQQILWSANDTLTDAGGLARTAVYRTIPEPLRVNSDRDAVLMQLVYACQLT